MYSGPEDDPKQRAWSVCVRDDQIEPFRVRQDPDNCSRDCRRSVRSKREICRSVLESCSACISKECWFVSKQNEIEIVVVVVVDPDSRVELAFGDAAVRRVSRNVPCRCF